MPRIRASWPIIIAVILTVLAVRPLRQQAIPVPLGRRPASEASRPGEPFEDSPTDRWLRLGRARAIPFVQKRYPNDPAMLLAAALVAGDDKTTLPLIRHVAQTTNYPPAWAAYFGRLEKPSYARLGSAATNPLDPKSVAQSQEDIRRWGLPDRLDPKAVAPILDALHSWQTADPQNALPLAFETNYLYGLHRDSEALARWEQAAKLPTVSTYFSETVAGVTTLLLRLGAPDSDAVLIALLLPVMDMSGYAILRDCARIAQYEGYLASMEGRPADAIAWWRSTADLGQRMQQSAESMIEFLVGVAVEGIGAGPTWKWCRDSSTGVPNGPLQKGRFFFGDRHDFYVKQVGPAEDAALRDRVVQAKVRMQLARGRLQELYLDNGLLRSLPLLMLAGVAGGVVGTLLFIYLAIGSWRRKQADATTALSLIWQLLLAVVILLPAAIAALNLARPGSLAVESSNVSHLSLAASRWLTRLALNGWVSSLSLLFAIFLPLVAAALRRQPGARIPTAWRGNARRVLPTAAAICALTALGLLILGARYRAQAVRRWTHPGEGEMATIIKAIGPSWHHPTIPPDSWRAEYPPKKPL